jgi:hypothetical protein
MAATAPKMKARGLDPRVEAALPVGVGAPWVSVPEGVAVGVRLIVTLVRVPLRLRVGMAETTEVVMARLVEISVTVVKDADARDEAEADEDAEAEAEEVASEPPLRAMGPM